MTLDQPVNALAFRWHAARVAGVLTVLLGAFALAGWVWDIPWLRTVLHNAADVKVNTAVGLVLAGSALFILGGSVSPALCRSAQILALIVAVLGLATLGEYVFDWQLGIDELLLRDTGRIHSHPGRMSPYSALAFSAIGLALAALPVVMMRPLVGLLSALVSVIGVLNLLGYAWNESGWRMSSSTMPAGLQAAFAYALLGTGTWLASHRRSDSSGMAGESIGNKVMTGFVAALLLLVIGGGITYRGSVEFSRSSQWVAHTHEVRVRLGQLYGSVVDSESSARAYLLMGTRIHKAAHAGFSEESRRHLEALGALIADNPSQQRLLERLKVLVIGRLEGLAKVIRTFDGEGTAAVRPLIDSDRGTPIMESIRGLTREMDSAEVALLSQREQQARGDRRDALVFLFLTLAGSGAIFAVLLRGIRREMLARTDADDRLRQLNAELERRVEERTAQLGENQRRFVDLFELSPDALLIIDGGRTIVQANRQAEAMFGWKVAELIGQPVEMLVAGEPRPSGANPCEQLLQPAAAVAAAIHGQTHLRGLRKDGTTFPTEISMGPLQAGGGVGMMLASIRDISERERVEEKIRGINADLERRVDERTAELVQARQAAEDANRAKSAFLATMSHEIRTPMNGVVGMLEVLSRTHLTEHQADAVRTIRTSAFALLRIIDDILDFSKIEAGRLDLERAPVALGDLVENVAGTLAPVAIDKDVDLDVFVDPRLPSQAWSDSTRLRQVLLNLVGNAIKFSAGRPDRRGRVSIRAEPAPEPGRLALRIADNGIGMSAETLSQLFTSFTQAEASTTRRFGGTGLGLAISKRLVTLMGGDIQVQSTPGKGSVFTVSLPLEEAEERRRQPTPDLAELDCIVVGSHLNPEDLRAYLEHAGARVHLLPDLDAAAQRARGLMRPVVIHNKRRQGFAADDLRAAFAATADARHVVLLRGRQRPARLTSEDAVMVDASCLRRSSLLRAVAVAAGRASPEVLHEGDDEGLAAQPVTPPSVAEARAQGRLILVAEDDAINQKVILRQLEILGHAAEVADNGAEALRLWRTGHYALLLTDLHMPHMDGYALAEAIRQEETRRSAGWQGRMPILALTANALRGEAARAQAAGMDEYLTKPLQLQLLKGALAKWLPRDRGETTMRAELSEEQPPSLPPPPPAAAAPAVDLSVLESLVGEDEATVHEFLLDFRASATRIATDLRAASSAGNHRKIGMLAHRLKSSSRSVGALVLGDVCAELENAARAGTREDIAHGVARFEQALQAVEAESSRLLAQKVTT